MEHLPKLVQSVCPDSKIAQEMKCSTTKIHAIVDKSEKKVFNNYVRIYVKSPTMVDDFPLYGFHSRLRTSEDLENRHLDCKTRFAESSLQIGKKLCVLDLNIEGISKDKSDYITQLAEDYGVELILLQETHADTEKNLC